MSVSPPSMVKLDEIGISQILQYTAEEILDGFCGSVMVRFDDDVLIEMNEREISLNRYVWDIPISLLNSRVTSKMCFSSHYNNGVFNNDSFVNVLSAMAKLIITTHLNNGEFTKMTLDPFRKMVIEQMNFYHNTIGYGLSGYATILDVRDFLDMQLDPPLIAQLLRLKEEPCEAAIKGCYNAINNYAAKNKFTGMGLMWHTGSFKPAQIRTLIGPRGGVSEINGIPYLDTVTNSYFMGLSKTSWYFQESRTAARAAVQSKTAIQESDTQSKAIQAVASYLSTIEMVDCGSDVTRMVTITKDTIHGKSNLKEYHGKFYKLSHLETKYKMLHAGSDVKGKGILIRSVHNCKLHEQQKVCIKCFGGLGYNLPYFLNLGHFSITVLGKLIIQGHLATKHHLGSTFGSMGAFLKNTLTSIFELVKYKDKDGMIRTGSDFKLTVPPRKVCKFLHIPEMAIAFYSPDKEIMLNADPVNLSVIDKLTIETKYIDENGDGEKVYLKRGVDTVSIKTEGRTGYFTKEFLDYALSGNLKYMKKHLVVNMSDWDYSKSVYRLINKEYNFRELTKEMEILTMLSKTKEYGNIYPNMDSYVNELTKVINSKMKLNVSLIEAFAYSFARTDCGRLPRGDTPYKIYGGDILDRGSLAPAVSFSLYTKRATSTSQFTQVTPSHPVDILFRPDQYFPIESDKFHVPY